MTVDFATEFQMYRVWTVSDLQIACQAIPDLWRLVGMKKREFQELVDKANLTIVDGIDVYGSKLLYSLGIKTLETLREVGEDDLIQKVMHYQAEHETPDYEMFTEESLREIKQNAITQEIIPIQWG